MPEITCKTCEKGTLKNRKIYRMSGPAVFIGYIFLIPSILGMLLGMMILFSTGSATDVFKELEDKVQVKLRKASIPQNVIDEIIKNGSASSSSLSVLNTEQQQVVEDASLELAGGRIGAGAGLALFGGTSIMMIIASFCGGLLGWLLTMKKRVLQCKVCKAVIQAS